MHRAEDPVVLFHAKVGHAKCRHQSDVRENDDNEKQKVNSQTSSTKFCSFWNGFPCARKCHTARTDNICFKLPMEQDGKLTIIMRMEFSKRSICLTVHLIAPKCAFLS